MVILDINSLNFWGVHRGTIFGAPGATWLKRNLQSLGDSSICWAQLDGAWMSREVSKGIVSGL